MHNPLTFHIRNYLKCLNYIIMVVRLFPCYTDDMKIVNTMTDILGW